MFHSVERATWITNAAILRIMIGKKIIISNRRKIIVRLKAPNACAFYNRAPGYPDRASEALTADETAFSSCVCAYGGRGERTWLAASIKGEKEENGLAFHTAAYFLSLPSLER